MSTKQNASGISAGAGPLRSQVLHMMALANVGTLSLDLWRAEQAVIELHGIYVRKIRQFEALHGSIKGALNPRNHEHIAVIAYTMDEKQALSSARRKVHAARRRLRAACAKLARTGAESA